MIASAWLAFLAFRTMFLEIIEWQLATSTDGPYDVVYEQIERVPHPITYDRKGTLQITIERKGYPCD